MFDIDIALKKLEEISFISKIGSDASREIKDDIHLSRLSTEMIIQLHLEMQTLLLREILKEVSKEK